MGAKALSLEGYAIEIGAKADFVVIAAEHIPEAVVGLPANRRVFKNGRLVAENGKTKCIAPEMDHDAS